MSSEKYSCYAAVVVVTQEPRELNGVKLGDKDVIRKASVPKNTKGEETPESHFDLLKLLIHKTYTHDNLKLNWTVFNI